MTVETRPVEVPAREKSVADVLRHAARIIEERGWCQGYFGTSSGPVCALGAVYAAGNGDPIPTYTTQRQWEAIDALRDYLDVLMIPDISHWNDMQGRTAAEVIAALRAAADEADR